MEIQELKNYILENHKIEAVLLALGCHHISHRHGAPHDYYTCGNPDGDNPGAITCLLYTSFRAPALYGMIFSVIKMKKENKT